MQVLILTMRINGACMRGLFSQIRSESPSQVFLVIIAWLFEILKDIPVEEWEEIVLSYDNMCHVNSMKVAQSPLPLPEPYDTMWIKITKVFFMQCSIINYTCIHIYMKYFHTGY